jgi:hypothetical protein
MTIAGASSHEPASTGRAGRLDAYADWPLVPKVRTTVSMTNTSDRFTALPDEETLAATVVALEEHGFGVEVVDGFEAARKAVLARIPRSCPAASTSFSSASQSASDRPIPGEPMTRTEMPERDRARTNIKTTRGDLNVNRGNPTHDR